MSKYLLNYILYNNSLMPIFSFYFLLSEHSDDESLRDQNQSCREQRYSVRGQSQQTLSCDSVTFKTDSTGILRLYFQITGYLYDYFY